MIHFLQLQENAISQHSISIHSVQDVHAKTARDSETDAGEG